MNKPRILIIENSIAVTGALKAILKSAHDLRSDFDFFFIIPKNSQTKLIIEKAGFAAEQFNMIEINKNFLTLLLYLPQLLINASKLKKTVSRLRIDLIHVNDLYNLIPPVAVCVGMRVPYISHVRFLPNRFPEILFSTWMKIHVRFANKIIAVSQSLKNSLPKHVKIVMIYDGFPFEKKLSAPVEKKNTHTFLYLANFIRGKGQDHALAAFAQIHAKIPHWKLRFVGGDMGLPKNKDYLNELHQMAEKTGLTEKIEWAGFTEDVEREYRSADIVINFSESESFSMTCAEALYFGIPTIASDSGGPAEIIDHTETGLLVANRQLDHMSEGMLKLATDSELREFMKQNSIKAAQRKFSPEKTSAVLKELYTLSLQK
jgi:glycosyltransferase involved in cell wall biosynthesis